MTDKPITVRVDHSKLWSLAKGHPIHFGLSVAKTLKAAGVPLEHDIEFHGVTHGQMTFRNEHVDGKRWLVYEWMPDQHSKPHIPAFRVPAPDLDDDEDDEL
jgi:hypothetical protein